MTMMNDLDLQSWLSSDSPLDDVENGEKVRFLTTYQGGIPKADINTFIAWAKLNKKRTWSEDEIKNLVQTNDKVLYGALRKLYDCQTDDEKSDGITKVINHKGFNGVDAPILTSFCEFLNKTGFLTPKQKIVARKKLVKYNKQLTRLANV